MSHAFASLPSRAASAGFEILRDATTACLALFKIMVPIIILVKIVQEAGAVDLVAAPLAPLMEMTGLPPLMGIVWATAMLNNLYSAIVVFASLIPGVPVTGAQATVLATMMLVAHNLPLELGIARKAGALLIPQLLIRFLGALAVGVILHHAYQAAGVFQEPVRMLWQPPAAQSPGLLHWAAAQAKNLATVFAVVLSLMTFLRILKLLRVTDVMNRVLAPGLRFMGIGSEAATIAILGLTLGLAYGGGLIIHEARSGRVGARDCFAALSLMGLCHALFEDTLLMMLMGGHVSGIFWGRLVFSLLATAMLVRLFRLVPETRFGKYLGRSVA